MKSQIDRIYSAFTEMNVLPSAAGQHASDNTFGFFFWCKAKSKIIICYKKSFKKSYIYFHRENRERRNNCNIEIASSLPLV